VYASPEGDSLCHGSPLRRASQLQTAAKKNFLNISATTPVVPTSLRMFSAASQSSAYLHLYAKSTYLSLNPKRIQVRRHRANHVSFRLRKIWCLRRDRGSLHFSLLTSSIALMSLAFVSALGRRDARLCSSDVRMRSARVAKIELLGRVQASSNNPAPIACRWISRAVIQQLSKS
jgi:hypothetical protein